MPDPTTSNILLAIPTRGSDVGVWDVPVNGDFTALDGIIGGAATIALSAATTILLSLPATGTVAASAGPNQSQNNVVKFTGTMAGLVSVQLTLPRTYMFDTTGLTMGTSFLVIRPVTGTGNLVALPPGEITRVLFDGTACSFIGMGRVGSFMDMAVATTPGWISQCTQQPYLPCDGTIYTTSVYPALGAILGSTFGGNGITTFGTPDTRNRFSLPIDPSGQGRVTSAVSGVDGTAMGSAGGDQRMQSHTHTATVTEPNGGQGHSHVERGDSIGGSGFSDILLQGTNAVTNTNSAGNTTANSTTGITITNANAGTGSSQNMPPVLVFGTRFIKT